MTPKLSLTIFSPPVLHAPVNVTGGAGRRDTAALDRRGTSDRRAIRCRFRQRGVVIPFSRATGTGQALARKTAFAINKMAGANNDTAKSTRDFPMMMRLMFRSEPSDHGTLI